MVDAFKVVVHCGEPAELKWNSGDPFWVCATCRKMLRRGTSLELDYLPKEQWPRFATDPGIKDGETVCGHGNQPFECAICREHYQR